MAATFTVVVPTFNRKELLPRTIRSAYQANWPAPEIIVVDDASSDGTAEAVESEFPHILCLRLERNSGPGVARNLGLQHASHPWVVLLDDDDLLLPGSLSKIAEHLSSCPNSEHYPCFQFSCSNGSLDQPFRVVRLEDYLQGRIIGDFVPVINHRLFRNAGLAYPSLRIGGEHLLWYDVARRFGIPTWNKCVAAASSDPRPRLCSSSSQLRTPAEYADLAARTLSIYGDAIWSTNPKRYWKYAVGAVIYYLLACDRKSAWMAVGRLKGTIRPAVGALVFAAGLLPTAFLRLLFRIYRTPLAATTRML
jgi:GalNAc5-diNAcBac-PP-undecaprenol beta-1,3-glucosyltransferase